MGFADMPLGVAADYISAARFTFEQGILRVGVCLSGGFNLGTGRAG